MAELKLARIPAWLLVFLALSGIGALIESGILYRLAAANRAIEDPTSVEVDDGTEPEIVLAKAAQLNRDGHSEDAIRLYGSLLHTKDSDLRARALHNLGSTYLREGARLWNARGVLEYARVTTLVEMAKEHLREALRLNPELEDARFNLEYAWRITPPPKEKPKSDWKGSKASIFATLPGIPAGGP